jgi:basic amino acid/polyamine antiporter, APA family
MRFRVAAIDRTSAPPRELTALPGAPVVSSASQELRPVLGMKDLALMIVGTVIGSGIFLVPGVVLRSVGNSLPLALLAWVTGGVLSLLGALTYGELSAMNPKTGGLYVYIRDGFGAFTAFLFGWTMFFVISSGSIATLAVAFSNYLAELLPLSSLEAKAVTVLVIVVIAAVNIRGTRQSANLLNVTTAAKVLTILVMSGVLLWQGRNPIWGGSGAGNPHVASWFGFGFAMISVLWAYEGWQYPTYVAGETVNPQRTFPMAFLLGTLALLGIYVAANLAYVAALGASGVAESTRTAASALGVVVSHGAARFVALVILVSIFSAANSIMLNSPRVYYAMAKDGLFFHSLARVHPRFGTPAVAIAVAGVWSTLLAVTGTFEQLLTYVVFIGWIFYALAAASIFIYRRRFPDLARPYRVPGYPLTPILFVAVAMGLVASTLATQPKQAAIGLGIMFLGAPAYAFWRRGAFRKASAGPL